MAFSALVKKEEDLPCRIGCHLREDFHWEITLGPVRRHKKRFFVAKRTIAREVWHDEPDRKLVFVGSRKATPRCGTAGLSDERLPNSSLELITIIVRLMR